MLEHILLPLVCGLIVYLMIRVWKIEENYRQLNIELELQLKSDATSHLIHTNPLRK